MDGLAIRPTEEVLQRWDNMSRRKNLPGRKKNAAGRGNGADRRRDDVVTSCPSPSRTPPRPPKRNLPLLIVSAVLLSACFVFLITLALAQ